jgi:flagellar hook-length control protein FliK
LSDLAEEALPTAATLESGDSDEPVIEPEIDETELLQDPGLLAGLLPVVSGAAANSDGEAVVGVAQAAAGQTDVLPLSGLISKALNVSTDEEAGTDPATGESESAMDGSDNPDFLLLNSKAALNKLAETNLTSSSLDKSAPAPELAKASPVGALVESLGRLNEAQSPAARAFVVQTGVQVPVGSPQWSQAVGDKVLWFAAQNVSSAEIRLDPPELGPMQVKVSVNQDQASITFTSPHPVVREALDQQLNRLREMFSEQGLNLLNVDVSDRSFAQQEREQGESSKGQDNSGLDDEELSPVAVTQIMSTRLVDHYA